MTNKWVVCLFLCAALSTSCNRRSECIELVDAIAYNSQEARKEVANPQAFQQRLAQAARNVAAIPLSDPYLIDKRGNYVKGVTVASGLADSKSDRPASAALGRATGEAMDDINLFCSAER